MSLKYSTALRGLEKTIKIPFQFYRGGKTSVSPQPKTVGCENPQPACCGTKISLSLEAANIICIQGPFFSVCIGHYLYPVSLFNCNSFWSQVRRKYWHCLLFIFFIYLFANWGRVFLSKCKKSHLSISNQFFLS